jgi:nucleotide-binding universal stress UspA family protein
MEADLVVLGTHGRAGLEHLFLGSVAEKLIRRLPCSVVTVSHEEARTWAAPGLITRIVCATDFSEMSKEALRFGLALAEKHHASMTLLHVVENLPDPKGALTRASVDIDGLRRALEQGAIDRLVKTIEQTGETGVRIQPRAMLGSAHKEILRIAAEERADLIVIGAQGHGLFEHMLSGSNAQHVIRHATCPVLTVRPPGAKAAPHDSRLAALRAVSSGEFKAS